MNLGFSEMIFIFLVALIIFGPKKLPEIGRQVGKALAEFKRTSNEFKSQLEAEMRQLEVEEALRKEKDSLVQVLNPPAGTVISGSLDAPESGTGTVASSEPAAAEAVTPPEPASESHVASSPASDDSLSAHSMPGAPTAPATREIAETASPLPTVPVPALHGTAETPPQSDVVKGPDA